MKANELMTGDYVRVGKDGLCIPKDAIVKIRAIDELDSLVFKSGKRLTGSVHCQSTENDFFSGGIWVDYLEPIPLTEDILEKNGWKGRNHTQWKFFRDGCDELNILLGKDYTQVEYLNMIYNPEDNAEVNYGHSFEFPRTIYVHELQHVLRLCEIDKTIKL